MARLNLVGGGGRQFEVVGEELVSRRDIGWCELRCGGSRESLAGEAG
jgi:hypothetical protein